jgi:hypothetical protein
MAAVVRPRLGVVLMTAGFYAIVDALSTAEDRRRARHGRQQRPLVSYLRCGEDSMGATRALFASRSPWARLEAGGVGVHGLASALVHLLRRQRAAAVHFALPSIIAALTTSLVVAWN